MPPRSSPTPAGRSLCPRILAFCPYFPISHPDFQPQPPFPYSRASSQSLIFISPSDPVFPSLPPSPHIHDDRKVGNGFKQEQPDPNALGPLSHQPPVLAQNFWVSGRISTQLLSRANRGAGGKAATKMVMNLDRSTGVGECRAWGHLPCWARPPGTLLGQCSPISRNSSNWPLNSMSS